MSKRRRFNRIRRRSPRRAWRRFRRGKAPIPVLPVLGGVVAPMAIALQKSNFLADVGSDPMKAGMGLIDQIGQRYTGFSFLGYEQGFHPEHIIPTYTGLIAGIVGHKLASKFGVNRQIKRIPMVGKWIQL